MLRSKVNKSINKLSLPDCNICKQMVDLFCRMVKYAVRQHSRLSQRQLGFLFIVLYGFYSAAFLLFQGVYNSWKSWKSPSIYMVHWSSWKMCKMSMIDRIGLQS